MSLFQQFEKVAKSNPQKVAIITSRNQLTFENLLEMVDYFDVSLTRRLHSLDPCIAMVSTRLEFYLIMMLVASRNSYKVLFADPDTLIQCGVDFDCIVSETDISETHGKSLIKISSDWFDPSVLTEKPNAHRPVVGNAVFGGKTSGSTGQPMIYPVKESEFLTGLVGSAEYYLTNPVSTRSFCSVGISLLWSYNVAFRSLLQGGSALTIDDAEERKPHLFDLHGVNMLAITPAFAAKLLAIDGASQFLQGIQKIVLAGAFVSPNFLKKLSEVTPASITVAYGSTENNGLTAYTYDPDIPRADNYLGDIVDPDYELTFFDPDTREPIRGSEGLVGIRNPNIPRARAYLNTKGDRREHAFKDGYFIPGDIVRLDGNSLYHLGRASNLVNIGGNKVSIDIIEQLLARIPELENVTAFSARDENDIERLYLAYSASRDLLLTEFNSILEDELQAVKITHVNRRESFPLNISTKIDRQQVIAEFTY